jgi:hypothetical protein
MSGSTMLNVAYGLSCDSSDDLLLTRTEKFASALIEAVLPTKFLVVSLVSVYAPGKCRNRRNSLECISGFEAPSFLDARWFFQEVDQTFS